MSADIGRAVHTMVRLYDMLQRNFYIDSADAAWEMDEASADALLRAFGSPAPRPDVGDGVEPQCLGIPVMIVERPGIRLVFTVTDR